MAQRRSNGRHHRALALLAAAGTVVGVTAAVGATAGPAIAARAAGQHAAAARFGALPGQPSWAVRLPGSGRPVLPGMPGYRRSGSAAKTHFYSTALDSTVAGARSTGGDLLHLQILASNDVYGRTRTRTSVGITLTRRITAGTELHDWSFTLPASALTYRTRRGQGSFTTGATRIAPYGAITLGFTKEGVRKIHCKSGSDTEYLGRLQGSVQFKAGGHWGSLGSRAFRFGGHSTVYVDNNCVFPPPPPPPTPHCVRETSWSDTYRSAPRLYEGFSGSDVTRSFAYASRDVHLARPHGAFRFDEVIVRTAAESFAAHGSTTWSLRTPFARGRAVSGSNVTETSTVQNSGGGTPCKIGKSTQTEDDYFYSPAVFHTSPRGLTAYFGIGGNFTARTNHRADFDRYVHH